MIEVRFAADGDPVPQGSTRAFAIRKGRGKDAPIIGVGTTNDASGRINQWRSDIRSACRESLPGGYEAIGSPVSVVARFRMRRPKSHYRYALALPGGRELRRLAPRWHAQDPDVDKLARALLDALTDVVWRDDHQVVRLRATKEWDDYPGVDVLVTEYEA